jgi:hypothetical protein
MSKESKWLDAYITAQTGIELSLPESRDATVLETLDGYEDEFWKEAPEMFDDLGPPPFTKYTKLAKKVFLRGGQMLDEDDEQKLQDYFNLLQAADDAETQLLANLAKTVHQSGYKVETGWGPDLLQGALHDRVSK